MLVDPNWNKTDKVRTFASTILSRAADLIEQYGHVKKSRGDKAHGFCLIGAIEESLKELGQNTNKSDLTFCDYVGVQMKVAPYVGPTWAPNPTIHERAFAAVEWNNQPTTTPEEVIRALRETADVV